MKFVNLLLIVFILTSCSSGDLITVFRDAELDETYFHDGKVIISPFTGEWSFIGKDTTFYAIPDAKLYIEKFSTALKELRPCINLVDQAEISNIFPGLEISMSRRKYCYNNMEEDDYSFFGYLEKSFNARYLIYFESIEFFANERSTLHGVAVGQKESKIIFQFWDLKRRKMVYRAMAKGNSADAFRLFNEQSSNAALESSFEEFIESLPQCVQKY